MGSAFLTEVKVSESLEKAFGAEFEKEIEEFALSQGLVPEAGSLQSERFLSRSVVPHIKKLSSLFNREEKESQAEGLSPYWKETSNPAHLRLAYFLYFMPSNLFRVASVWSELSRLGFRWNAGELLRGIEFGAGPAAGACGIAAGEKFASAGLPRKGNWALIEQDKAMLELGSAWAEKYFLSSGFGDWGVRKFHRKIEVQKGLLPRNAPQFNLWIMSFFLNEIWEPNPSRLASELIEAWDHHLEDEAVIILVEPALKQQSRRLLELRKALIDRAGKKHSWMKVLLPCLGHQACGALQNPEDWCHEEVSWWRPPYFRTLDRMAELDRKTLPFSYLVLIKSERERNEILPELSGFDPSESRRLVSPVHWEGRDQEFFTCGQEGKKRTRYRGEPELGRGDILLGSGAPSEGRLGRVEKIGKIAGSSKPEK